MRNIKFKNAERSALGVFTAMLLGAGAFVTNFSAQNVGVFEIQVPFDFVVMGRTYSADRYRIGRLDRTNPDKLVLKSSTDKTLLIFLTHRLNSGAPTALSKLTFSQYGDMHVLDAIRASGSTYENRVPAVKSDRRRRSIAQASQIVSITTK
jgi:hypothetical protein